MIRSIGGNCSPVNLRLAVLPLWLAAVTGALGHQPVMDMAPRWAGGYGVQLFQVHSIADDLRRVSDQEVIKFSAAGFRDFTRIAASDPTMWRDVFLTNKDATIEILGRFTEELMALQRAIRTGDGEQLHAYFTHTRAIRRGILEAGQDTDKPDFGRVKVER